jgi:phasin family protein
MFGQFSEQMKNPSQPASELLAANIKAIEAVTKQQTQFFSGLVDDSVKLMQSIAKQTEIKDVLAAQAVYAESVTERLTISSAVTYETISSVSQQYTDALKSGYEAVSKTAQETVKPATTKKGTVKAAPVVKAESVVKAPVSVKTAPTENVSAKSGTVLTETPTTAKTVKKPINVIAKTATKTKKVVLTKPVSKTLIKDQSTPKATAKPVAMLSAEEIKAPAKTKTTEVITAPDNKSARVTKA